MPFKIIPKALRYYNKILLRKRDHFSCPHCKIFILPKEFEKHCSQHDIDAKTHCVWCGQKSWEIGSKNKNADHLIACSRKFMCLNIISELLKTTKLSSSDKKNYRLLNMDHMYIAKKFYGHASNSDVLSIDSIWPLEIDDSSAITFTDENLNLAASCVRKYLETEKTHDWIHIMVKSGAFESFVRAMDEDGGSSRTLPFSCWCDGGHYKEAKHRQHRHLIVVSLGKGRFKKEVWSKVKMKDKPFRNFPCHKLSDIQSPLHFINALGYLSHRESSCNFSFDETLKTTTTTARSKPIKNPMNHFYIYKTLPKNFLLPLVLQFDDGIAQLLYQQKFQNISIPRLAVHPLKLVNGRWEQKIIDFYELLRGLVLPVSKKFLPSEKQVTPFFFCLMSGKKIYFQESPENERLNHQIWLQNQINGGNCFYEVVGEEIWIPRKRDQEILNYYIPLLQLCKQLMSENKSLEKELKKTMKRHESEEATLKRKHDESEEEIATLKRKRDESEEEIATLKRKRDKSEEEIATLKRICDNLEDSTLKKKLPL